MLAFHEQHTEFDPQLLIKVSVMAIPLKPTLKMDRHEVQGHPQLHTKLNDNYISKPI